MKKNCISIAAFGAVITCFCLCARAQDQNQNDKSVKEIRRGVDGVDASVHAGVDEGAVRSPDQPQSPAKPPATYSRWGIQPKDNSTGNASSTAFWNGLGKSFGNASNSAFENANSGVSGDDPGTEQIPATRYWPMRGGVDEASFGAMKSGTSLGSQPALSAGAQQPAITVDWSDRTNDHTPNMSNNLNYEKPAMRPDSFSSLEIGVGVGYPAGISVRKTVVPALPQRQQPDGFSSPFRGMQFGETSDTFSATSLFSVPTFSTTREQLPTTRRKTHPKEILDSKHGHAAAGLSNGRGKSRRSLPTTKSN